MRDADQERGGLAQPASRFKALAVYTNVRSYQSMNWWSATIADIFLTSLVSKAASKALYGTTTPHTIIPNFNQNRRPEQAIKGV